MPRTLIKAAAVLCLQLFFYFVIVWLTNKPLILKHLSIVNACYEEVVKIIIIAQSLFNLLSLSVSSALAYQNVY